MAVAYAEGVDLREGPGAGVAGCYERLIDGWNRRDGRAFADPFADDAILIGYDGSEQRGRDAVASAMAQIFRDHDTAAYVAKVRTIRPLGATAALLHAVAGMVPPGGSDLAADRNAHQTVVAVDDGGDWRVLLFQNTPARFDGRPDLAAALADELREARSEPS